MAMNNQMHYNMVSSLFRLPSYWREEKEAHEKALELLSIFNMENEANVKAGSLPYGAQRRLEIVRALATQPRPAAAGRTGCRHEPVGNLRADGEHQQNP